MRVFNVSPFARLRPTASHREGPMGPGPTDYTRRGMSRDKARDRAKLARLFPYKLSSLDKRAEITTDIAIFTDS